MQRIPNLRRRLARVFKKKLSPATQMTSNSGSGDVALDLAGTALEITSAFTDGLNVPGLKGVIAVATMVLKLAQVS